MLDIPKAEDAKVAAEKRAAEIIQADYDVGKRNVERAIAEAIQDGKKEATAEIPLKVADKIVEELQAAGYRAKRETYRDPCEVSIDFRGKVMR